MQIAALETSQSTIINSQPVRSTEKTEPVTETEKGTSKVIYKKAGFNGFLIPTLLASIFCFWPLGFAAVWQILKVCDELAINFQNYFVSLEIFSLYHSVFDKK